MGSKAELPCRAGYQPGDTQICPLSEPRRSLSLPEAGVDGS